MDWYYAIGADRKGPFNDEEFQRLVQQGIIASQTLVWREGFSDWRPYGESAAPTSAGGALEVPVTCDECGGTFSRSDVIRMAEGFYCAACKPLALQRLKEGVHSRPVVEVEQIRKAHIKHEASVQSVGWLYYLGALVVCIVALALLAGFADRESPGATVGGVLGSVSLLALGAGQFWVGTGLRRLQNWARIPTGILSGIGLLGFPLGTIINAYILYLIFSAKGKTVFSDEYHAVIRQTPHIKYRTSIVIWICFGFVLLLISVAIFGAILRRR